MTVRTRFAPSPTGYMHIGNLRTALYAFLFARKNNGKFILRIEDTDQARYVPEAVEIIYQSLKLAGLTHDEGPDIGGEFAPYTQSERKTIYRDHAEKLLSSGHAYYCFCNAERLKKLHEDQMAAKQPLKYDGLCRQLAPADAQKRVAAGEPFVVRQKIPAAGTVTMKDEIFGDITVDAKELEDGVLLKSDGLPTYNFANVVDDHLMQITHVIRGTEFISSTPKYNLLYSAFGWTPPIYVHLPPIAKNSHQKMSKREGDASFQDFLGRGFIVPAIINYIALLGWHPKTEQEMFTLEELQTIFDLNGLQKAPAIFDEKKLRWFNAQYLQKMPLAEFSELAAPFYAQVFHKTTPDLNKVSAVIQLRTEILSEIPATIDFLEALPEYDSALFTNKKMKTDLAISKQALELCTEFLRAAPTWQPLEFKEQLTKIAEQQKLSNGQLLWPLRVALSGKEFTPGGAIEIMDILGREETLRRLEIGLQKLI